ncbi:hypothetical protein J3R30DRAFT_1345120 [Lentinula aciculospora]|uniref:3'-5' exonuclease domain-containing protein n=1 Tax=Lentinula aciculospora TaxID=153920 RepID=A0A9W9ANE7_9AGAR|nr:hypothetical protein J3R30DRAFT_1345120 [Lentinula aciculospora]
MSFYSISSRLELLRLLTDSEICSPTRRWSLCDTEESLEDALSTTLSGCKLLALDCEGDNLGRPGGTLSIICIRELLPSSSSSSSSSSDSSTTLLIDVLAFTRDSESPKRFFSAIVESGSVQKIVFDGRMDFCAFFYEYGVRMQNAIDIQLAAERTGSELEAQWIP